MRKQLTGEPVAGKPHTGFGGRGRREPFPTPIEILAVIQSIDKKAGTVALRGVKRTISVMVPESVDIKQLKVGDEVRAAFVEAAVISVERTAR